MDCRRVVNKYAVVNSGEQKRISVSSANHQSATYSNEKRPSSVLNEGVEITFYSVRDFQPN